MATVFEKLAAMLRDQDAAFDVLEHEPVFTSEEAAQIRGTSLSSGAKALICKAGESFLLFVLPANLRLASKQVRKQLGLRSLRFASREEVLELTGLKPGSIPPFGSLFDLKTNCDELLRNEPVINFNAGDHSISMSMSFEDFVRVEHPEIGSFSEL